MTVLLRSVWTSERENGAMGAKKRENGEVVEFLSVVSLESMDGATKLGGHKE